MSEDARLDKLAILAAEEVLQTIYGDDFQGCTVSPTKIAKIIKEVLSADAAKDRSLLELYAKVVEGIHLLSTPPDASKVPDPAALKSLLSERLDDIHTITTQTTEATRRLES